MWLLCNVHFVKITQRTRLQNVTDLKPWIISAVKIIDAPILTRVCGKDLSIVSMCAVSPVVRTSNVSRCQKRNFFSFPVAVNNSSKEKSFGFLVINVCSHGEHYETPGITLTSVHIDAI